MWKKTDTLDCKKLEDYEQILVFYEELEYFLILTWNIEFEKFYIMDENEDFYFDKKIDFDYWTKTKKITSK